MTLGTKIGYGVLAFSTALVGAMVWAARRPAHERLALRGLEHPKRKGPSYDDVQDVPSTTIREDDRDGYKHRSEHPKPRKSSRAVCKAVKTLANTSANVQIMACQGGGEKPRIQCARDVYDFLRGQGQLLQEEFVVLALNARNDILAATMVSRGSANETPVSMLDTFRPNIIYGATRAILAHNHPSGNTVPSGSDVALTERAVRVGKELGVNVIDHIIVGKDDYSSLRELGMANF